MNNRTQKLSKELQRVISAYCLKQSELLPILIHEVIMINRANAHIHYLPVVDNLDHEALQSLHQQLLGQIPKVRRVISQNMVLRYTPNIHFKLAAQHYLS